MQYGPASSFILVGGRNLSGDVFTLVETVEQLEEQSNGLGTNWETHAPFGMGRISLEDQGGLYDDRVAGLNEGFAGQGTTLQLVDWGFAGSPIGADVSMADGDYVNVYKRISNRSGFTKADGLHKITGNYRRGQLVSGFTSRAANADTKGTPADDNTLTTQAQIPIVSN